MKNLKRVFSAILAMIFILSVMPAAMAEGEETAVKPEIRLYRTYDNYTGGNHRWETSSKDGYIFNNGGLYGSWFTTAPADYNDSTAVQGYDGTAVQIISGDGLVDDIRTGFEDISNGKLYIGIDMWKTAEAEVGSMFWKLKGSTNSAIYALCWQPGVQWCKESQSWMTGERSTDFMAGSTNKNRAEIIIDPEAGTIDKYFNGSYAQTQTFTPQTITTIQGLFKTGQVIDNLVAVYYPEGCEQGSFSLTSAKIDAQANAIKVFLNSDVTDADGANGSSISAPYGITLSDVNEASFSVTNGTAPLTVTGVTKGTENGEYVIAVSEELAENINYTVTVNEEIKSITGEGINENAKTLTTSYSSQPEIMFYRDYEDYTGGNNIYSDTAGLGNRNNTYGTLKFNFVSDRGWDTTTVEEGLTGKGFAPARTDFSKGSLYQLTFPASVNTKTDGKIYITFTSQDIANVANDGNTAVGAKDGHRYFGFDHGTAYSLGSWSTSAVSDAIPETGAEFYKIDIVFDLEEGLQKTYINNVLVGNKAWNSNIANPAASYIDFWFENGVIIDNIAMLYYPENIVNQTFSLSTYKFNDDGTISVFLKSDAVDSDGRGVSTKSSVSAPYGTALPSTSSTAYTLGADTFSVDGLTVKGVTRGTVPGEYVIEVEEKIAQNTAYTVTAKAGLTDILGATVNSDANSIEIIDVTEPEIMFYRDFEDYEGGNPYNDSKDLKDYGTWGIDGSEMTNAAAVQGLNGTAVQMPALENNNNFQREDTNYSSSLSAFAPKKNGKLYFAFDLDTNANVNATDEVYTQLLVKDTASSGDMYAFVYRNKLQKWATANSSWQGNTDTGLDLETNKNKVEVIFDIDNGRIDRYINGVKGASLSDTTGIMSDIAWIKFLPKGANIIDNLAVVHYPAGLKVQQTFSMTAAEVNNNGTISVFLKSDAVDSDGKGTDTKSAIAAPYGITLLSDSTAYPATYATNAFSVDGLTITGITKGKRDGEYVIAVAETLSSDGKYTVTAKEGLTDILGAVINSENNSASTTAAEEEPKFEISAFTMEEGTATVTYTNTTETPEKFMLMVASYVNGAVSEIALNTVTASTGDVAKVETASLKNGVDGKMVKAFIWDADTYKPLRKAIKKNYLFRILGRYEETTDGYSLNWPNSGIEFSFKGTDAAINVGKSTGTAYFTPYVDGVAQDRITLTKGLNTIASDLDDEVHTIKLVRSSEARFGRIWINGIEAENIQPLAAKDRLIEFYGDSYTAGYGNIGADGSAESMDTQKAYSVLIADHFNADANLIAYSGKGMAGNGVDDAGLTIAEMSQYSDIVLNTDSKMPSDWNFNKSIPDLVVIFLGTNDSSTASLTASVFEETYKDFISTTRERYGDVKILCLTRNNIKLTDSVENVVNAVKATGDNNIAFYEFESFGTSGGHSHPSAAEDIAIAEELKAPIAELMGW